VQIIDQVARLPGFYDYVIYICLNGLPDVVSENVLHTSLIRNARVSEAKWCDEGSCELVGLLHLYLVVPKIGIKEA
jgi:hypothetical protein